MGGLFNLKLVESGVISPGLSLEMFGKLVRILVNRYLRNISPLVLITSKKMEKDTCIEHLERRRQIIAYISKNY